MDRQDREALYMILERNGRIQIELQLDLIHKWGWDAVVNPYIKDADRGKIPTDKEEREQQWGNRPTNY